MPISGVSNSAFTVLCCWWRFGKRKLAYDLILQIDVDNTNSILSTVHFGRGMGRRKLLERQMGKRDRLQVQRGCNAVLWLLLICTLKIALLAIFWARFMNDLLQFHPPVYILAPEPVVFQTQKLWCECTSLPSLQCLLQPALGSPIAVHGSGICPQLPLAMPALFEWRQHMDDELCCATSWCWGCLGKENLPLTFRLLPPWGMMASTEVATIHSCHGSLFPSVVCRGCPSFSSNNLSWWPLSRRS